mgnify:CR=1 FL=1
MESFGIGFGLVIGVWVIGFSIASIVSMLRGGGNISE